MDKTQLDKTYELAITESNGATFSLDKLYRYKLWRTFMFGEGTVTFVCLNPSTADEVRNDPTVRKCLNFAQRAGFHKCYIGNIFAYRNTDPETLYKLQDPIGIDNDKYLVEMAKDSTMVIFAWGNHGVLKSRGQQVAELLWEWQPSILGNLTKLGCPQHPLYLPSDTDINDYQKELKWWRG